MQLNSFLFSLIRIVFLCFFYKSYKRNGLFRIIKGPKQYNRNIKPLYLKLNSSLIVLKYLRNNFIKMIQPFFDILQPEDFECVVHETQRGLANDHRQYAQNARLIYQTARLLNILYHIAIFYIKHKLIPLVSVVYTTMYFFYRLDDYLIRVKPFHSKFYI